LKSPRTLADPRAARPILDGTRHTLERDVDVAVAQVPRDVRQPRAERQHVHAMAVVGDRMEKVQQHPRIAVHRAGDVAQHAQRRCTAPPRSEAQRRQRAARAHASAQRRAKIDPLAPRRGDRAPDRNLWQRQLHPAQQRLDLGELVNGHRREILFLQHFARRKRERRVEIGLVLDGFAAWRRRRQHRLREAGGELVGNAATALYLGQQCGEHLFEQARIAPEEVERLLEQHEMLALGHDDGSERLAEIVAVVDADRLDGRERVEHLGGAYRQTRSAQHPDEVDDVVGEASARHRTEQRRKRRRGRGTRCPGFARLGFEGRAHPRVTHASSRRGLCLAHQLRRDVGRDRTDVVLILEQRAKRVGDGLRIERDPVERHQGFGPVERLGDSGRLEQVQRAQPLGERDDLARQRLGHRRALAPDDRELAHRIGKVDPVIQAAPLDRVVDLARAVRRDDDDRRRLRPQGAEFGIVTW
jgi:hypothetical protein